jgi:Ketopantoate reductase
MKILFFGRGVISTQYAWAFEKVGHTVEFYVRPGRKSEFGQTVSLNIYDTRKNIKGKLINEEWSIKMIEDFNANHDYDLIFVSVQHYQFQQATEFLSDKIGKATLLIFNNFWDEPLEQITRLPADQLVWGFPQAGGGFNKNILNGTLWGSITIGTFGTEPTKKAVAVMNLFQSAGIKSNVIMDFRSWLFGHFIMNAAMHLETLKYDSSNHLFDLDALQTTQYWKNVKANGKELLPILKVRNVNIKASPDLKMISLPPWLMSVVMKVVLRFLPAMKQLFTGHSNQRELKSYCQDVLKTAEKFNINLSRYEENKELYR